MQQEQENERQPQPHSEQSLAIKEWYDKAIAKTKEIYSMLTDDGHYQRPIQLRNPFIFYLGHVAGFASIKVNQETLKKSSFSPTYDVMFERGLDPDVFDPSRCHDHSRAPVQWPSIAQVNDYVQKCRQEIFLNCDEVEKKNDSLSKWCQKGRVHWMSIEHELLHQETLMFMYLHMDAAYKIPPPKRPPFITSSAKTLPKKISIKAGKVELGAKFDALSFGWDNEFPAHVVDVPAFEVDDIPVTNEKFLEFVQCGAYEDKSNWASEQNWQWKTREAMKHPASWQQTGNGYVIKTLFNENISITDAGTWPVFVSLSEAQAYARWKGRRIMTEPEWCRIAYTSPNDDDDDKGRKYPWGNDEPTSEHGNFNWTNLAPTPVGSHPLGTSAWGVQDLIGDAWEWTSSVFAPFHGFEAMDIYPGYSADFFPSNDYECPHYVLKGASFAVSTRLIRPSFRNWFQSCYPYVWAKFRLANDL